MNYDTKASSSSSLSSRCLRTFYSHLESDHFRNAHRALSRALDTSEVLPRVENLPPAQIVINVQSPTPNRLSCDVNSTLNPSGPARTGCRVMPWPPTAQRVRLRETQLPGTLVPGRLPLLLLVCWCCCCSGSCSCCCIHACIHACIGCCIGCCCCCSGCGRGCCCCCSGPSGGGRHQRATPNRPCPALGQAAAHK